MRSARKVPAFFLFRILRLLPTPDSFPGHTRTSKTAMPELLLTTARLLLRPWRAEDAAALYEAARDPRVGPAAGWPPHRSVAESAGIIRTVFSAPETYAVTLRGTDRPVGCVGLLFPADSHFAIGGSEAEVGYWLGRPWWGRGLIPEAVGELARHAFEELGLTALWASCFVDNAASRRVLEKCGFRYVRTDALPECPDGTLHRGEIRLLTREAWLCGATPAARPDDPASSA